MGERESVSAFFLRFSNTGPFMYIASSVCNLPSYVLFFFSNGLSLSLPFLSTFFIPNNQHTFLLSTFLWAWPDKVTMLPVYSVATHILLLFPLLETRICTVFFFSVLCE